MTIHQHTFRAIGCTNSVLTTDATTLEGAAREPRSPHTGSRLVLGRSMSSARTNIPCST